MSRPFYSGAKKAKNVSFFFFLFFFFFFFVTLFHAISQELLQILLQIVIKEICSWLPPFCKQNLLLFIQPRWQLRRTYENNENSKSQN